MKLLFGLLVVLSISFFAFMQWGAQLTVASKIGHALGDLHPEKIKLVDALTAKQMVSSAVPPVQLLLAVSAPVVTSSPVSSVTSTTTVTTPVPAPAKQGATIPGAAVHKNEAKVCMEWGEFSGTDLKRAEQALAEFKLGENLTQRTVEYNTGYWVHLPSVKNKTTLNRKIEQLKKFGVEDFYVMQEKPHWINVISLGVFKTQEAANNYLASLKKKGVRSAIVDERKSKLKFVVFQIKQMNAEQNVHLNNLQKEFENSELNTVTCK
jgi:aspartokinase